jgi:transcriptional accessory protein Tex/SPT6
VAISLARFYQNPIAEILKLWGENPEDNLILSLNLHKLQKFVSEQLLIEGLKFTIIQFINEIGVEFLQTALNDEYTPIL